MIFFTLGTHQPFDRLVEMVDRWCSANAHIEILGQLPKPTPRGYKPEHFPWVTQLCPDEYRRVVETADFVVAHAGMGSIITALCLAKPIVIFPRLAALNEQRNDHQVASAKRFSETPGVSAAFDEAELFSALDRLSTAAPARGASPLGPFADVRLTDRLRQAMLSKTRPSRESFNGVRPAVFPQHSSRNAISGR